MFIQRSTGNTQETINVVNGRSVDGSGGGQMTFQGVDGPSALMPLGANMVIAFPDGTYITIKDFAGGPGGSPLLSFANGLTFDVNTIKAGETEDYDFPVYTPVNDFGISHFTAGDLSGVLGGFPDGLVQALQEEVGSYIQQVLRGGDLSPELEAIAQEFVGGGANLTSFLDGFRGHGNQGHGQGQGNQGQGHGQGQGNQGQGHGQGQGNQGQGHGQGQGNQGQGHGQGGGHGQGNQGQGQGNQGGGNQGHGQGQGNQGQGQGNQGHGQGQGNQGGGNEGGGNQGGGNEGGGNEGGGNEGGGNQGGGNQGGGNEGGGNEGGGNEGGGNQGGGNQGGGNEGGGNEGGGNEGGGNEGGGNEGGGNQGGGNEGGGNQGGGNQGDGNQGGGNEGGGNEGGGNEGGGSTPAYDVDVTVTASKGLIEGAQEVQVNSGYTRYNQGNPETITLKDGGFVVVWETFNNKETQKGIFGQRFDSDGNPIGPELHINSTIPGLQADVKLTALEDGGFVAVWESQGQDGSGYAIVSQRFDDSGHKVGGEQIVNTNTYHHQTDPDISVVSLCDGCYVVAWESYNREGTDKNLFLQKFDGEGNPVGKEISLNTTEKGIQENIEITALEDGGFVAVWQSEGQDGSGYAIVTQQYDAEGHKVGSEHVVNTRTIHDQTDPSVTTLSDGSYVIVWEASNKSGSNQGVLGQRFDSEGNPLGKEFLINNANADIQGDAEITALSDGGFVVVWESNGQDGSGYGVYGQRYDASGQAVGTEFQVNTATAKHQSDPSITALDDGGFVVVWESKGQDEFGYGVFAQRFDSDGNKVQMQSVDQYDLDISADLGDATLTTVTLSGLPEDSIVDGAEQLPGGEWSVPLDGLGAVQVILPESVTTSIELTVTATGTDSEGNPVQETSGAWLDPEMNLGFEGLMLGYEDLNIDGTSFSLGDLIGQAQDVSRVNLHEDGQPPTDLTLSISVEDVLTIAGENKTIFVDGDENDTVNYESNFTVDTTNPVDGYTHYSNDSGAHLYINEDVSAFPMG